MLHRDKAYQDQGIQNIRVFPNPTYGSISITGIQNAISLEVYNVLGARIMSRNLTSAQDRLDVSNLRSGVYMFRFTDSDDLSVVKKVVKR